MKKHKKILITGSEGFVGKNLLQIYKNQADVKIYRSGLKNISDRNFFKCDLRDEDSVLEMIKSINPDQIYHLAGSFCNLFKEDLDNNVISSFNLLRAVETLKIKSRILLVGSAAEYGKVSEKDNPIKESNNLSPASIYGLTKIFQTYLMQYFVKIKGLDVVMARVFNLIGKGSSEKLFVGNLYRQIKDFKKGKIKKIILGNIENKRDYLEVEDAVIKFNYVMEKGLRGEIYNIGSGTAKKTKEILNEIIKQEDLSISFVEFNKIINKNYDAKLVYADVNKLSKLE